MWAELRKNRRATLSRSRPGTRGLYRAVAIGAAGAAIAAPILRIPELILDGLPLYNSAASNLFRARGGVAPFMQSIEYNIESVFRGF